MDIGNYFIMIIDFCYSLLQDFDITCFGVTFTLFDALIGLCLLFLIVYAFFRIFA